MPMEKFEELTITLVDYVNHIEDEILRENTKTNLVKCVAEVLVRSFKQNIAVNNKIFLLGEHKKKRKYEGLEMISSLACFTSKDKVDSVGKYQQLLDVLASFCRKDVVEASFLQPNPKRVKIGFESLSLDPKNCTNQISENLLVVQQAEKLEWVSHSYFAFSTVLGYIQVLKKVGGRLPEFLNWYFFGVQPSEDFIWPTIPYAFIEDPAKNKKVLLLCLSFGPGIFELTGRIKTFNSSSHQRQSYSRILQTITTMSYSQINLISKNIEEFHSQDAKKVFESLLAPIGKTKKNIWTEFQFILQSHCSTKNYKVKSITKKFDYDTNFNTDPF